MIMTLQEIKSVLLWLSIFSFAKRFIYIVAIISLTASLVYWEWYSNWWIIGSAAAAFLLATYLEIIIYEHNMRVMEYMKKIQEELDRDKG